MRPETNASLRKERIGLIELHEKESSKAKALRIAAETITDQPYDYVLILDADNLISPCYLQELNKAVSQGIKAIQTHRKAKNMNTDIALLDAAIEEMNNSIFRKGHIRLGFSSALTGSGMAFDFRWFVRNIIHTHSTGEDKELEELLLRQGIHIEYIDTLETLDEKVRQPDALRNQRRRWIATQLFLALKMGRNLHSLTERKRRLSAENPPSLYRPPQHSVGAHRILFMCSLHFLSGFFHKVVDFAYLAERCVIPGHSVQYEI